MKVKYLTIENVKSFRDRVEVGHSGDSEVAITLLIEDEDVRNINEVCSNAEE